MSLNVSGASEPAPTERPLPTILPLTVVRPGVSARPGAGWDGAARAARRGAGSPLVN